ncbi:MAG TPA: FAD-dependent oxidoreductase [bacterium]|nr:FAD-dependent oxidoreductase [bacterium]
MILIAGAGLAGLSTAFHLQDREYRLIERAARPGGLCRTERRGAYAFDYGGHLLHIRGDDVRGLARELLGEKLMRFERKAAIFSKGVTTPYPFQVNTYGLPREVVRDCLAGFVEAMVAARGREAPENFHDWIFHTFGAGFAEHFFLPFNEKFFKTDLRNLTTEWAGWSIPRPELRDVVNGALGIREREFGYNAEFYYPRGGIEELPRALAAALARPVEGGTELVEVIPAEKRAVLSSGEEVRYEHLVSSLPLDRLISILRGAPSEIAEAAGGLSVLSVLCVNLGITGPAVSDLHWLYVPEPGINFHRIGFYSNFTELGPGRSALYLEITLPGPMSDAELTDIKYFATRAASEFRSLPLYRDQEHKIEEMEPLLIEHGYVVYNRARRERLPGIMAYLRDQGIEPVGRYGRWEYSTMEEAIREGREAAEGLMRG